jgi:hypothetical protein
MQRDIYIEQRAKFCKKAMNSPKLAADELRIMAEGLENCRNSTDVVAALCEIFKVSDRTILYDLVR